MASVRVATSSSTSYPSRASTCLRRIKSHEPGQRVMTEAIAFLFAYAGTQYGLKGKDCVPPSAEEFFAYVRHLSTQTYHVYVPGVRRKVSNRLLGGAASPFQGLSEFLDFIEPLNGARTLVSSLIQAQNIGLRALTCYNAFVDDESDIGLKSHIAEPFVWFSSILFYDAVNYRERGLGSALRFIQEGVAYLLKHAAGKRRLAYLFEMYEKYAERGVPLNEVFRTYLSTLLA
jgi:hypothetical protein